MPGSKKTNRTTKKNLKPEVSYKVVLKKTKINPKTPKKIKTKIIPKSVSKFFKKNLVSILGISIILFIISFTIYFVTSSITKTLESYNSAQDSATSFMTVDKNQISTASVVGSDKQLQNEIINFQSAPDDLREFTIKDYRKFKSNCVVNGNLIGTVNYKIENVVYDKFSKIVRTCVSNETVILAKVSNNWTIVFSGNSLPECSLVNSFNLPQGVSYNCLDGLVTYTNPNP
jgi:hypothetical protein